MADGSGYRVAVKSSAREAGDAVRSFVLEEGDPVEFTSRTEAVSTAADLSASTTEPIVVQRAAPQDRSRVDAYFVAQPERHTHDPAGSIDDGLVFETSAKQYGALGETLVGCYRRDPPVFDRYVRADLEADRAPHRELSVRIDRDPDPFVYRHDTSGGRKAWFPDLLAVAVDEATGRPVRRYACEVKTGEASLAREQRTVMGYVATETPALVIRVDITGLPDRYRTRFHRIDPTSPPPGWVPDRSVDTRLTDFA